MHLSTAGVVLNHTNVKLETNPCQLTSRSFSCGSNMSVSLFIYEVADVSSSQCTTNFNCLSVSPLLGEVSRDGGGDTKESC